MRAAGSAQPAPHLGARKFEVTRARWARGAPRARARQLRARRCALWLHAGSASAPKNRRRLRAGLMTGQRALHFGLVCYFVMLCCVWPKVGDCGFRFDSRGIEPARSDKLKDDETRSVCAPAAGVGLLPRNATSELCPSELQRIETKACSQARD